MIYAVILGQERNYDNFTKKIHFKLNFRRSKSGNSVLLRVNARMRVKDTKTMRI